MALVVPDIALATILKTILRSQVLLIRLYTNKIVPDRSTVKGDFTEVSGGDYSPIKLGPKWTVVLSEEDMPVYAEHAEVTWTFTAPIGSVYGYYVLDSRGNLLWAEAFEDGPYDIKTDGDRIRVTPRLTLETV